MLKKTSTEDEYWPSTPPEIRKQIQDQVKTKQEQKIKDEEVSLFKLSPSTFRIA